MADLTPVQIERAEEARTKFTRPSFLLQVGFVMALILIPLFIPSFRVMDVLAKIMILAVAVASFDLILGYTGQLSLGHAMFFGFGAYSLGLVIHHSGTPQLYHFAIAVGIALAISIVVAVIIAFFSLRVKAIFFAMMTLALAEFGHILAVQWYDLTLAEDGVSFKLPSIFSVQWSAGKLLGADLNGRLVTYYVILIVSILLFVGMLRFVRSPVGRVLQSIRDNEQRSIAIGFRTFRYQTFSIVFGSAIASLSGVLFAMWLRYVNPDSVISLALMLNILLMCIIGGMGTMYGAIIGAAFLQITETWLPDLQKLAVAAFPQNELVQRMAERWILYFGILFVLVVYFFPKGVVGTARDIIAARKVLKKENTEHA